MLLLLVFHVIVCLVLVGLVLIQQGQGADAGAAFGSGASATVFGSRGAGSFLTRLTAILATVLFLNSLVLAYLGSQTGQPSSVTDKLAPAPASQPASPAPAGADTGSIPSSSPAPAKPGS